MKRRNNNKNNNKERFSYLYNSNKILEKFLHLENKDKLLIKYLKKCGRRLKFSIKKYYFFSTNIYILKYPVTRLIYLAENSNICFIESIYLSAI